MSLLGGFATVFSLENIGVCLLGSVLGLIVGAMPGIGSLAGCALLLPLTYKFDPTAAIIMLGALYYSNMYGGAFSAILLNVPGDSPAVMTVLDGHPMAKRGQPGQALFTSNLASCIGGIVGMLILAFLGPALANIGLHFGPAEMTAPPSAGCWATTPSRALSPPCWASCWPPSVWTPCPVLPASTSATCT